MKQYMLLPEDSIELLRAQDEAEAAVCVFCERTMILFPCSKIEAVSIQRSVTEDRLHPVNCLELLVRLGAASAVGVDIDPSAEHIAAANAAQNGFGPDRFTARTGDVVEDADFLQALEAQCPALLENIQTKTYQKETCDQTGSHLHKHS